jgi:hypothetical protein
MARADEMTTGAYQRSSLQAIHSELTGWVGQARVILTCRLNLWDTMPNALLNEFEIYRTLPFSYGDGKTSDQVGEFITKWFKGEQLGQELCQALEQPGKERIKDLAKNPLRLALLCRTWHLWREQGGLPDTKAKLYQGFVDDFYNFYESRPNKPHVKKQQRRKLNEALGKLAKWALDRPTARFRLRLSQIPEPLAQILGDEDEEGSLLWWLVSELNWLINIGDSAESPGDTVYTFFHPTFQEYFAALAIDDWHFFLNHIPENPSHPDASYRIFEPQWKEVFLLWLGRQDVEREHKEQFIQALVEFEDGCEGFYWYRGYFLAAAGIAEVENCSRADVVVTETVKRSFGFFDEKEKTWKGYIHPVPLLAQTALLETDCSRATYVIAQQIVPALALHSQERLALKAAEILGLIGSNNPRAISALVMLISNDSPSFALVRSKATKSLVKIGTGSQEAIRSLTQLLSTIQNKQVLIMVAGTLGKIDPGNLYAKNFLIELMYPSNDEEIRLQAAWHLLAFDNVNYHAVNTLDELKHSQKRGISWQASMILENGSVFTVRYDGPEDYSPEEISTAQECWNNSNSLIELLSEDKPDLARREAIQAIFEEVTYNYSETIAALVEQLYICQDTLTLQIIIEILGEVAIGDESVVRCLIHFIQTASPLPAATTRTLSKILRGDLFSLTVVSFKNYLQNENYKSNPLHWSEIYQVIWYCAQIMTYSDFYNAWHS